MSLLLVKDLEFKYSDAPLLRRIDFSANQGDVVTICGPSGCGKTTLLLLVAGILTSYRGYCRYARDIAQNEVLYCPQHDILLPWLSVEANIDLGSRITGNSAPVSANSFVNLLGIKEFAHKPVSSLSGGMRKRVCLARTIKASPKVLLLDEPFNNLDFLDRRRIESFLRTWVNKDKRCVVCVTHDIEQAIAIGDSVCYFHNSQKEGNTGPMRFSNVNIPASIKSLSPADRRREQSFHELVRKIISAFQGQ